MNTAKNMLSAKASKALVAALVAGVGAAVTVLTGSNGQFRLIDCLTILGTMIGAWQAVYWTTNAPDESAQPPQAPAAVTQLPPVQQPPLTPPVPPTAPITTPVDVATPTQPN